MDINKRKAAFVQLGQFLSHFSERKDWPGYACGINQLEFDQFNATLQKAHLYNGWFTESNVRLAIQNWSEALNEKAIDEWISAYPKISEARNAKTVAIIMAGNIPFVGLHDLISVLISGHNALIKCSSDDNLLLPALVEILIQTIEPDFKHHIKFSVGKLEHFDAVIATGSDNSSRYFDYYFGKHPHIIRSNRTSVGVLNGKESKDDLFKLGHDIFDYFGLGCRNVSKLFIPNDFDLNRFFEGIFPFADIINHNKYANNFDYNKAIYLMNKSNLLENGFVLLKEDEGLHSPLGVLFYERYSDKAAVTEKLEVQKNNLQCVVGENYLPFGNSQLPQLWDYADNIDTLDFLLKL